MFQINYIPVSDLREKNITKADDMSLRYSLFLGDVVLKDGVSEIDLSWGWIPLLDFAFSLLLTCTKLDKKDDALDQFDFTESDDILNFHKTGRSIRVSTSFSDEEIYTDFEFFKTEVYRTHHELTNSIIERNPEILNNESFGKYRMMKAY